MSGRAGAPIRRTILAVAALVAASVPVFAALPPWYQRTREMQAILESPDVEAKLGTTEPIVSVIYVDVDRYEISNGNCTLLVSIVDVPAAKGEPMMVGPRRFAVEAGDITCGEGE